MNPIDLIIHVDKYLGAAITAFGPLVYAIIFLVIFIETGLVIMPILPGDSFLFAAGAFSAINSLNILLVLTIAAVAAILGDSLNYWIGNKLGRKLFSKETSKVFNKAHLEKTEKFYDKYGAKTIVLARFMPIIRTFAPFVAGMGKMKYSKFLTYNIIGGVAWVLLLTLAGYYFSNIPFVKNNFSLVIVAIIVISIIPLVYELISKKKKA